MKNYDKKVNFKYIYIYIKHIITYYNAIANLFNFNYGSVDPHFSRASPLDRRDSLLLLKI